MSSTKGSIRLYNFFLSSASWRVRAALNYKQIPFEYIAINLQKGEQLKEEYIKKNPMKHVPALEIDNVVLYESLPIMEYLEETRPEHALLPKDPVSRARVRAISELINSGIQPLQNLKVGAVIKTDYGGDVLTWQQKWINSGFEALELALKQTMGKYCFGDTITMADCCLYPQASSSERFKINLDLYPNIKLINQNLDQIEAFRKSSPVYQPDYAPPQK